jgi:hypothetical protein
MKSMVFPVSARAGRAPGVGRMDGLKLKLFILSILPTPVNSSSQKTRA